MTRDQDLVGGTAGQIALSVGQVPVFQSGVDAHLVVALLERQHLIMREAKSPVFLVVRSSVRDPVRCSGRVNRCGLSSLSGMVACTGTL